VNRLRLRWSYWHALSRSLNGLCWRWPSRYLSWSWWRECSYSGVLPAAPHGWLEDCACCCSSCASWQLISHDMRRFSYSIRAPLREESSKQFVSIYILKSVPARNELLASIFPFFFCEPAGPLCECRRICRDQARGPAFRRSRISASRPSSVDGPAGATGFLKRFTCFITRNRQKAMIRNSITELMKVP
jgi:hypothetical protein